MSKAQGQFTIVDYNDALTLTGYIGSNLAKTQMYNPDNDTYSPNWASTNVVLTPSLYVIGTTTDHLCCRYLCQVVCGQLQYCHYQFRQLCTLRHQEPHFDH